MKTKILWITIFVLLVLHILTLFKKPAHSNYGRQMTDYEINRIISLLEEIAINTDGKY